MIEGIGIRTVYIIHQQDGTWRHMRCNDTGVYSNLIKVLYSLSSAKVQKYMYSGTYIYGHLTSMVTSLLWSHQERNARKVDKAGTEG